MKNEITSDTVIVKNMQMPSTSIDGEVGLMSIDRGKYYSLNSVGTDIWNLLEKPTSIKELVAALTSEYQIDADECMMQVRAFVEKLMNEGIVIVR